MILGSVWNPPWWTSWKRQWHQKTRSFPWANLPDDGNPHDSILMCKAIKIWKSSLDLMVRRLGLVAVGHDYSRLFCVCVCIIEVLPSQRQELFCRKLAQCTVLFDFEDANSNLKSKDIKRQALQELTDYVATKRGVITDYIYPKAIKMVNPAWTVDCDLNLFFLDGPLVCCQLIQDDPTAFEPYQHRRLWRRRRRTCLWNCMASSPIDLWILPTLFGISRFQRVYGETLHWRTLHLTGELVCLQWIAHWLFVLLKLLELFDSEDPRERDFLKTTLHRIYGKFLGLRAFIRKSINHIFFQFVYETEQFNGVAELLEILGRQVMHGKKKRGAER